MNKLLNAPELSLSVNLPHNSPWGTVGTNIPISWEVLMVIFAVLAVFYLAGKLENKEGGETSNKAREK